MGMQYPLRLFPVKRQEKWCDFGVDYMCVKLNLQRRLGQLAYFLLFSTYDSEMKRSLGFHDLLFVEHKLIKA